MMDSVAVSEILLLVGNPVFLVLENLFLVGIPVFLPVETRQASLGTIVDSRILLVVCLPSVSLLSRDSTHLM